MTSDPSSDTATSSTMEIRVTEDGPYVVSGGVPLSRRRPVVSEHGEPLTWRTTESLDAPETYELCRCGHSDDKPFCSGAHATVGFDGEETADASGYDARAKTYEGTGVTVRDDRSICEHAGFCANRASNVWKMVRRTEDTQVRSEMIAMVERCPSGALTYSVDGQELEPDLRPSVRVVDDGPLAVTGGAAGSITLVRGDGSRETRARMTLCRCGQSKNKPFCDGTHTSIGFQDAGS